MKPGSSKTYIERHHYFDPSPNSTCSTQVTQTETFSTHFKAERDENTGKYLFTHKKHLFLNNGHLKPAPLVSDEWLRLLGHAVSNVPQPLLHTPQPRGHTHKAELSLGVGPAQCLTGHRQIKFTYLPAGKVEYVAQGVRDAQVFQLTFVFGSLTLFGNQCHKSIYMTLKQHNKLTQQTPRQRQFGMDSIELNKQSNQ